MSSPFPALRLGGAPWSNDFARALCLMADALPRDFAGPVSQIAEHIEATSDALEEERGTLFHALHPRRGELGFPDDGAGEVEDHG